MKTQTTILIEIEVPVTYDIIPGQPQTWDEPGFDADIDDIQFDFEVVKKLIYKELEHPAHIEIMLEDGMQDIREQRDDYLYEQDQERKYGI